MAESQDPEDPIFGETRVDEPCGLVGQNAGCAQAVGKAGHGQDLHRVSFHPFTIVHPLAIAPLCSKTGGRESCLH